MYERFAPQDPDGKLDTQNGIVQLVVGTGGDDHGVIQVPIEPNEVIRDNTTFGYLGMTLDPGGYTYRFVPVAGGSFTDSGSGKCH